MLALESSSGMNDLDWPLLEPAPLFLVDSCGLGAKELVIRYQSQIGLVGLLNATAGAWYGGGYRMIGAWKRWSRGIHIG